MKVLLGNNYSYKELTEIHKESFYNDDFCFGFDLSNNHYIRFNSYRFYKTDDKPKDLDDSGYCPIEARQYKCTQSPEGSLNHNPDLNSLPTVLLSQRKKDKRYWTRDNKAAREAKKWGYRPEG